MKVAIFAAYPISSPHFETQLDIIQHHLDQGDTVTVLACNGEMEACDVNSTHAASPCMGCIARRTEGLKLISGQVEVRPFFHLTALQAAELKRLNTDFTTTDELQELEVDGFDIGQAVLSSLVSMTRDPGMDLRAHGDLVARLTRTSWAVYFSVKNFLETTDVDRVYVYNGRYAPLRAVLRVCQQQGVECMTHEKGPNSDSYRLYENTLPHDRSYAASMMQKQWDEAANPKERDRVSCKWYEERAEALDQDEPSFVKRQRSGLLPGDWNPQRHNVTIFVSSEDECVAIGEEWKNPLYKSQLDGLQQILNSLADDPGNLHFYLRVHPNLAKVDNCQTRALREISAPFLTVIPADDPVSTYALMKHADKVLTFGSTVGIEAVYWGVPSILAGMSLYRHLGATYNPDSHEHLLALLRSDLPPKDKQLALVYGYSRTSHGIPFRYYSARGAKRGKFKGIQVRPKFIKRMQIRVVRESQRLWRRINHLRRAA